MTTAWLKDVLNDVTDLPRTPGDPPDLALLDRYRAGDALVPSDLKDSCLKLIQEFVATGDGSEDYVRGLLYLGKELGLSDQMGPPIVAMAHLFPRGPHPNIQRIVLQTISRLGVRLTPSFWLKMFAQNDLFACPVLVGLLESGFWHEALGLLPFFPEREDLANAVASVLNWALDRLPESQRKEEFAFLRLILPRCGLMLRASLSFLVAEPGE